MHGLDLDHFLPPVSVYYQSGEFPSPYATSVKTLGVLANLQAFPGVMSIDYRGVLLRLSSVMPAEPFVQIK